MNLKGRSKKDRLPQITQQTPPRTETVMSTLVDFLSVPIPPDAVAERAKDSSKPTTPTDTSKDVKVSSATFFLKTFDLCLFLF